ncbi:hypothetical protein RR46_03621 [Papilio xuthus]|uniref:Uncharacterized protein n=1 Tax=Papilio xuthus TaxID=66420 RepID=A0A194Q0E8_PAPXU|nr:hypothetical protein RR46_03621 [Papilio xuthus]
MYVKISSPLVGIQGRTKFDKLVVSDRSGRLSGLARDWESVISYHDVDDATTTTADLSCRNTKQQVGALFTRSNFVTLKYVTDNWGTDANGFKLVITAVKDPKHGCKEFRCKQREFCVSADLACDGVDHCADGSDEDTAALCPESGGAGGGGLWLLGAAGGGALALAAAALALCCYCRRRTPSRRTHLHLAQMASSNGAGSAGKPVGGESPPACPGDTRLPGNWALPAGPRGYNAARPGRLRASAQR